MQRRPGHDRAGAGSAVSETIRVAHITTIDLSLRFLMLGQLRALRASGFDVATVSGTGPWTGDLESEGFRHIPWRSVTREWSPRADARAFLELVRILRRERFDIVHTHNPKPGVLGRVAARMAGAPCVVNTVHGLYATPEDRLVRKAPVLAIERLAGHFSDLELYQSEEDLAWARRIGLVSPRRSELLGNGVDLARFEPSAVRPSRTSALRKELGIPDGAPVVGTVARLVAEKGCRELFAAAREVCSASPDARFLVIGAAAPGDSGAIRNDELVKAGENVILTGWRRDVPELLSLVDVFVLASWREGVPRSAIEAAAMGKPLILTDIRGCREVVRNGVEGLLVPPRDPGRLAAAIELLLHDAPLRERFGAAARARAVERFDERHVIDLTVRHYRKLLERAGRVARDHGHFQIRTAQRADAAALARLHREGLPDAFLPLLGDRFLRRLYRALVDDDGSVPLVAEADGEVVGFVVGVVSIRGFQRRFYRRHGLSALTAAAPRLVRPRVLRGALQSAALGSGGERVPDCQLASMAVSASWGQRGVGKALVRETVSRLDRLWSERGRRRDRRGQRAGEPPVGRGGVSRAGSIAVHEGMPSNVWITECRS